MLPRSRLVSLATQAKRYSGVDLLLRYNPLVHRRVQNVIRAFERSDERDRLHLTNMLTDRVLASARHTRYGQGRSASYADWPVLTKAQLRDTSENFAGRGVLCIPAATGGT